MAVEPNKALIGRLFPTIQSLFIESGSIRGLQYWRERQLDFLFSIFALFGLVAYVPSAYFSAVKGFWFIALIDTIVYGSILGIHFS